MHTVIYILLPMFTQGYVEKARKRPEMFPETMLHTIFSNIESIYAFSSQFLCELEKHIHPTSPHLSEIGKCFLNHVSTFSLANISLVVTDL